MKPFYNIRVSRELIAEVFREGNVIQDKLKVCGGVPSGYELKNAYYDGMVLVLLFGPPLEDISADTDIEFLNPTIKRG